ncbi:HAD-IIB family hydrolase [Candidatus Uhrbacteria bacterium]|nr:HAD-IIB family hydrolase [Candidatus Uhrbacteria bacterium]
MNPEISQKELFVFDLDGTLARSKTPMDAEMVELFSSLLQKRNVAVIGGGWLPVFEMQLLVSLKSHESLFGSLLLFPTSGATFLRYEKGEWKTMYAHQLSLDERDKIKAAFVKAFQDIDYHHPEKTYGEVIEDRGTQITFSALGQQAPIELKDAYKGSPQDRRWEIVSRLKEYLPEFEIKVPGKSSIDVTMKGIDKGYGIGEMEKHLGIDVGKMIFVGDALYEGGNDEPVKRTGIDTIAVEGPEDTKRLIAEWLPQL